MDRNVQVQQNHLLYQARLKYFVQGLESSQVWWGNPQRELPQSRRTGPRAYNIDWTKKGNT